MAQQHRDTTDKAAGTHGFECSCGFSSTGHTSKSRRDARRRAHRAEHETGELMPDLSTGGA